MSGHGKFWLMRDEAIIQSVINLKAPKDNGSDEDDLGESNNSSWNQAVDALNIFIKFSQGNSSFSLVKIKELHIIRNNLLKKERGKEKELFYKEKTSTKETDTRDTFKKASTTRPAV